MVAVVILRDGVALDESAMRSWCKERLASYKVPRSIIEVDDLPRSMLGKVLRAQVREELMSAHR